MKIFFSITLAVALAQNAFGASKLCIPKNDLVTDKEGCEHGSLRTTFNGAPLIFCKEPPDYKGPKTPEWDPVTRGPKEPNDTNKTPGTSKDPENPAPPKQDPPEQKPPQQEPPEQEPPQQEPPEQEPPQQEPPEQEPPQQEPPEQEPPQQEPPTNQPEDPNPDDFNCANPLAGCTEGQDPGQDLIKKPGRGNAKDCSSPDVECSQSDLGANDLIKKPSPFERLPKLDCNDPRVNCSDITADETIPPCEDDAVGDATPGTVPSESLACIKNPKLPGCKTISADKCAQSPWLRECIEGSNENNNTLNACAENPWLPECKVSTNDSRCLKSPWLPSCADSSGKLYPGLQPGKPDLGGIIGTGRIRLPSFPVN